MGLKALCSNLQNCHVRVQSDNTTAVNYINNMGGTHSPLCNAVAKSIWLWAIERNIWLSCTYLPGKENYLADSLSRDAPTDHAEWMLNPGILKNSCMTKTKLLDLN